jgi:hypothetical protein
MMSGDPADALDLLRRFECAQELARDNGGLITALRSRTGCCACLGLPAHGETGSGIPSAGCHVTLRAMPPGSPHAGKVARVLGPDASSEAAASLRRGRIPLEILTAGEGASERVMGMDLTPTGETLSVLPECVLGRPMNEECPICLDEFFPESPESFHEHECRGCCLLPCGHGMCEPCGEKWENKIMDGWNTDRRLRTANAPGRCPVCRADVFFDLISDYNLTGPDDLPQRQPELAMKGVTHKIMGMHPRTHEGMNLATQACTAHVAGDKNNSRNIDYARVRTTFCFGRSLLGGGDFFLISSCF